MKKTKYPGVHMAGDGRYRIRAKVRNPKTGMIEIIKRIVEARSPAEAATMREAARREVEEGGRGAAEKIRLGPAATSWLASKLPALRHSTRRTYADALDKYILPALGDFYLDAITPQDIVQWRDAQRCSPVTTNGRFRVLKQVLADLTHQHSMRNPAERVAAMREPKTRHRRGLEPVELQAMLAKMLELHPSWYPITLLLAFTGMRWGEASALQWKHVDETRNVILIERAHVRGVLDETKTGIRREVPLHPRLAAVLREHRVALGKRELSAEARTLVFPSRTGGLMQPSSLREWLADACTKAKVPVISPHGLRHSFNHLARLVTANEVVMSMTGHVTEEMTTLHYDWVRDEAKQAAVNAMIDRLDASAAEPKTDAETAGPARGDHRGDLRAPANETAGGDVAPTGWIH